MFLHTGDLLCRERKLRKLKSTLKPVAELYRPQEITIPLPRRVTIVVSSRRAASASPFGVGEMVAASTKATRPWWARA